MISFRSQALVSLNEHFSGDSFTSTALDGIKLFSKAFTIRTKSSREHVDGKHIAHLIVLLKFPLLS